MIVNKITTFGSNPPPNISSSSQAPEAPPAPAPAAHVDPIDLVETAINSLETPAAIPSEEITKRLEILTVASLQTFQLMSQSLHVHLQQQPSENRATVEDAITPEIQLAAREQIEGLNELGEIQQAISQSKPKAEIQGLWQASKTKIQGVVGRFVKVLQDITKK